MTRQHPQWIYPIVSLAAVVLLFILPRPVSSRLLLGYTLFAGVMATHYGLREWRRFLTATYPQTLSAILVIVTALAGAFLLRPATNGDWWWAGWLVVFVGAALAAPALSMTAPHIRTRLHPLRYRPRYYFITALGLGCLGVVTLHTFPQANPPLALANLSAQHALFWLGVLLVGVGIGGTVPERLHMSRFGWTLLAITVAAAVPRAVLLENHIHYLVDEWIFVRGVQNVIAGQTKLLENVSYFVTAPYLFTYWQALAVALLGPGLAGIRLVSAIIGTLTVGAVGFVGYEIAEDDENRAPTALTAAGLLATYTVFLHYSRVSLYNIADPLFGTLAVAFVLRGLRQGSRVCLVWGGVALGLTSYFYAAGKLVFPVVFATWAVALLLRNRDVWRSLLFVTLAAGIVAAPAWMVGGVSRNRISASTVVLDEETHLRDAPLRLIETFTDALLMLTTRPDAPHLFYYGGTQGVVPIWLLPLFLAGLILTLVRPFVYPNLLLLLWLAVPITAMSLLDYMITARFVIVMPLVAVLCARGLLWLVGQLPIHRLQHGLVAVTLLLLGVGQLYTYFYVTIPALNDYHDLILLRHEWYSLYDLMLRLPDLPPNTDLHIIASHHPEPGILAMERGLPYANASIHIHFVNAEETNLTVYLEQLEPRTHRTFMLMPGDRRTLSLLQRRYNLGPPQRSTRPIATGVKLIRYDVTTINPDR